MSDIDHPEPLSRESNAPGGPPSPGAASLLDVRCVAARLGLSTKAVRGLILRGELAAYKVAGRIRVDAEDLEDYLLRLASTRLRTTSARRVARRRREARRKGCARC